MIDHIQVLDTQIETMKAALNEHGIKCTETSITALVGCEIADCYKESDSEL